MKGEASSLTELSGETSEGSRRVNRLRTAAVFIRVCRKERIDDKEGERKRANRWWIWQGLRHAGTAEARLEGAQSPEASLMSQSGPGCRDGGESRTRAGLRGDY